MNPLPDIQTICLVLVLCIVTFKLGRKLGLYSSFLSFFSIALLCGLLWISYHAQMRSQLPSEWLDKPLKLSGQVIKVSHSRPQQIDFKINTLCDPGGSCQNVSTKVRLRLLKAYVNTGDHLRLSAQLRVVHGLSNPGGGDVAKNAFIHNVSALGRVKDAVEVLEKAEPSLREKLRIRYVTLLKTNAYMGIVQALTVGDQSAITSEQWDVFRRTGTSHLVAISGLHVGMVAGVVFWLCFQLFVRTFSIRFFPPLLIASLGSIASAFLYSALAGWSIPTQRACMMICAFMLSVLSRRWLPKTQIFALALLGVLLIDPLAALSPGFWLSFAAVGFFMIFFWCYPKLQGVQKWLFPQVALCLAMVPLTAYWFGEVSLSAPLANLIAIPFVSFLIVPLGLLGLLLMQTSLGLFLLKSAAVVMSWLWSVLDFLALCPTLQFKPSFTATGISIAILLLAFLNRSRILWVVSLAAMLVLLWPEHSAIKQGEVAVQVFDVGQGTAVLLETKHSYVFYDFGPKVRNGFDSGRQVLDPYLKQASKKKVALAIVSHADLDHRGGYEYIANHHVLKQTITSQVDKVAGSRLCQAGQSWIIDGVLFEILHPFSVLHKKTNNQSCVLKVTASGTTVLLPGDIETVIENQLVYHYGDQLKSDLLIVPHHGSKSSSSEAFLKKVRPSLALLTVGYRNAYRLPNPTIVERYQTHQIPLFRTDQAGAIRVHVGAEGLSKPELWREQSRKLWHMPILIESANLAG